MNIFLPSYEKRIVEVLHSCDYDDEHNVTSFEKINCKKILKYPTT